MFFLILVDIESVLEEWYHCVLHTVLVHLMSQGLVLSILFRNKHFMKTNVSYLYAVDEWLD